MKTKPDVVIKSFIIEPDFPACATASTPVPIQLQVELVDEGESLALSRLGSPLSAWAGNFAGRARELRAKLAVRGRQISFDLKKPDSIKGSLLNPTPSGSNLSLPSIQSSLQRPESQKEGGDDSKDSEVSMKNDRRLSTKAVIWTKSLVRRIYFARARANRMKSRDLEGHKTGLKDYLEV